MQMLQPAPRPPAYRLPRPPALGALPWVQVAPNAPYFITDRGAPWTPIGQNDAITWPELSGLFRRQDTASVEAHLRVLASSGITCLRLMLEYCHGERRYLEQPVGRFVPNMVRLWDDLFAVCERVGLRILLTPFDTFFTWTRWGKHPYNRANGGPCTSRTRLLTCPDTRAAIKARLAFAADRWGGSGALFAWDLWNEVHYAQAEDRVELLFDFVDDLSAFLRERQMRQHGRAHPQTVSIFGPTLVTEPVLNDLIFRASTLDFATSHFYEEGTIDAPRNTVDAAVSTGRLVRAALSEIHDQRPFLDTEHGPIHTFKDRRRTLPDDFDDEYFRHMQWAHFASGGAGGGMRWPNRHPHTLTRGMRRAQRGLAAFLPLVDFPRFRRRNLNAEVGVSTPALTAFACGDDAQAIAWLLRNDHGARGTLRPDATPVHARVLVPGLAAGRYRVTTWDTAAGAARGTCEQEHDGAEMLTVTLPPITNDLAIAIRRA